MKKNLLIVLAFLSITTVAFAEFILAPQWSELCTTSYMTAKPSKISKDANYWYERRIQFENLMAQCNGLQNADLRSCYEQVRASEMNKNKSWNAKIEAQKESIERSNEYLQRSQKYDLIRDVTRMLTD